jgi:hypothetical protein
MAVHNNHHAEHTKMNGTGVYIMEHSITTKLHPMKNSLLLLGIALLSLSAAVHATAAPPILQFRLVVDNPTADSEQMTVAQPNNPPRQPEVLNVQKAALLDSSDVKNATASVDPLRQPIIDIKLTDDGAKRFADVTGKNVGERLAIVIDGKLYEAPRIASAITGGEALITGHFTKEEAENFAARINGSPAINHAFTTVFAIPHFVLLCLIAAAVVTLVLIFRKGTPRAD